MWFLDHLKKRFRIPVHRGSGFARGEVNQASNCLQPGSSSKIETMKPENKPLCQFHLKRTIRLLCNFMLVTALLSPFGTAKTTVGTVSNGYIYDGELSYEQNPDGLTLTVRGPDSWPTGGATGLEIPESVIVSGTPMPVTRIGVDAFDCFVSNDDAITGPVVIPSSVVTIGQKAFQN
ncbi:MAG: hypothetical protein KDN05_23500, partial [Verrucomicrobiae bacterium]|nr:hypothetical protein [Verrucomicrobiae bacterium]